MNDTGKISTKSDVTVAYLRTATADRVGSSIGLEQQRRACERHAQALGLRLGAVYADVGVSGLSEHRPALDQLMLDLARGHIRRVVIAGWERLARSWQLERRIRDRIGSHGATLATPGESPQVTSQKEGV
jgi:DNA invertase Pin-like site-specific DNA recombinase